jgi:hypothetical protein
MRLARVVKLTGSDQAVTGRANLLGFLLGTDGLTNVRFSIHNGTANTDEEVVPSCTYDATAYGLNGAMFGFTLYCPDGIYFNEESGANYELLLYYEQF